MKKSDLVYGNVVETRNGHRYLYYWHNFDKLLNLEKIGFLLVEDFTNEDLKCINGSNEFDIMKVYKDYTCSKLLWERKEKPKLTEDEKVILRNIDKKYKWVARDEDRTLSFHYVKPHKEAYFWSSLEANYVSDLFPNLFKFIQWEDDEPYLIEYLLGESDDEI